MRRVAAGLLALGALAGAAGALLADDSVFGIRGLGILGRPQSARSASAGGGFALFDGEGSVNPAALSRWRGMSGWAVGSPSRHRFGSAAGDASLTSTRFPLIGFSTVVGQRLSVGITISDFLDRTWSVRSVDTLAPRGTPVEVTDQSRSIGGVSDLRLGAGYRLSPALAVGVGLHALTGSTRLDVTRQVADSSYQSFRDTAVTNFSGFGFSAGALLTPRPNLQLGLSLRVSTALHARTTAGSRAAVALPVQVGFGAQFTPGAGSSLAVSVQYAGWARAADDLAAAGEERSRNVWSVGAGAEVETVRLGSSRVPVRIGYRWRQLPFPVGGVTVGEHAFTAGLGLSLVGGRTLLDVGYERGTRAAGALSEQVTTGYLGITVRP